MKFFRNNWYWMLSIVIGLGISSIIVDQRGQLQTSEAGSITSDIADHTPDAVKPPPPGTSFSGYWHNGKWHAAPHTDRTKKTRGETPTAQLKQKPRSTGTPALRQWRHHAHTSDHRKLPTLAELGLPQEKLDRILREANMSVIPEGGIGDPVAWVEGMIQKRVDILTEDMDTVSAFKLLKTISFPRGHYEKYAREYAQRAIDENPDFLEGRLYLVYRGPDDARAAAEYREILEDFPNSRGALTGLGSRLAMDHPVEAIYHLKRANRMNPSSGLAALGRAYQRLGDYKTAWVYLKKAQTYPHGPLLDRYVKAIEAGTPLVQPLPLRREKSPAGTDTSFEVWNALPKDTDTVTETFRDDAGRSEESPPQFSSKQKTVDSERERASASAKRAHEEFLKHQELLQKELDDFLQWAETIINAKSPMDTKNFLMKEMEAHLKGGQAHFEPDRIVRAFEIMERYGPKEGIKHLQKNDPEVAEQVQRLLVKKRKPQRKR